MEQKNWAVIIDDETEWYATRAAARAKAKWHNRHPANVDIRRFGPYKNVTGRARVKHRDIND